MLAWAALVGNGVISLLVSLQIWADASSWQERILSDLESRGIGIEQELETIQETLALVADAQRHLTARPIPPKERREIQGLYLYNGELLKPVIPVDEHPSMTIKMLSQLSRAHQVSRYFVTRGAEVILSRPPSDTEPIATYVAAMERIAAAETKVYKNQSHEFCSTALPAQVVDDNPAILCGVQIRESNGKLPGGWAFAVVPLDRLWGYLLPLRGVPNEVVLLGSGGQAYISSGDPTGSPPQESGQLHSLAAASHKSEFSFQGNKFHVLGLPTGDMYLLDVMSSSQWMRQLFWRNIEVISIAIFVALASFYGTRALYRSVFHPAMQLDGMLHEALARLEATFNFMSDGFCLLETDGKIIAINERFSEHLILDNNAIGPGADFLDVIRTNPTVAGSADYLKQAVERAREFGEATTCYLSPVKNVWFEMRISPVMGQNTLGVLLTDVTDRKQAEQNMELALRESGERLRKLNETKEQLVEAEKQAALTTLVAGIAHEVNTPIGVSVTGISTLRGLLDTLSKKFESNQLTKEDFTRLLSRSRDASNLIEENITRARQLMQSFKQVAVEHHVDEIRAIDLKSTMEDILRSLRAEINRGKHTARVSCPDGLTVKLAPSDLWHVISNLVMNSLLHGFEGKQNGLIDIRCDITGDQFRITYSDDGSGMTSDVARQAFNPFYTTKRGQGGSGLGLSIIHGIVTKSMVGTIKLTTYPGGGVRFTLAIPQDVEAARQKVAKVSLPDDESEEFAL